MGQQSSKPLSLAHVRLDELHRHTPFSKDQVDKLYRKYAAVHPDLALGGGLNHEQFCDLFGLIRSPVTQQLFRIFDSANSGQVVFRELVAGLSICSMGTLDEKLGFLFHLWDLDGTGYVSAEEMHIIVRYLTHLAVTLSENKASTIAHLAERISVLGDTATLTSLNVGLRTGNSEAELDATVAAQPQAAAAAASASATPPTARGSLETSGGDTTVAEEVCGVATTAAMRSAMRGGSGDGVSAETHPEEEEEDITAPRADAIAILVRKMFVEADTAKDGRISLREFKAWAKANACVVTFLDVFGTFVSVACDEDAAAAAVTAGTAAGDGASSPQGHDLVASVLSPSEAAALTLEDMEVLQLLGQGGFSTVYLCRARSDPQQRLMALKAIPKARLVAKKMLAQARTERKVLQRVGHHPFIARLVTTFSDKAHIYLLMEWAPGGELRDHLLKRGRFDAPTARFYAAEFVLAIEYLHSQSLLHRDVKLENVLLSATGHIKLTDFGLSTTLSSANGCRAYSFCGTTEYMAPEMLKKQGYSWSSDWWTFGIMLFEMLTGDTPFYDRNRRVTYQKIANDEPFFPPYLDPVVVDLLKALLQKNPKSRLGSKGGAQAIRSHRWFETVRWDDFDRGLRGVTGNVLVPPIIPGQPEIQEDPKLVAQGIEQPDVPDTYAALFKDF